MVNSGSSAIGGSMVTFLEGAVAILNKNVVDVNKVGHLFVSCTSSFVFLFEQLPLVRLATATRGFHFVLIFIIRITKKHKSKQAAVPLQVLQFPMGFERLVYTRATEKAADFNLFNQVVKAL